jgi:hypothetical protein
MNNKVINLSTYKRKKLMRMKIERIKLFIKNILN